MTTVLIIGGGPSVRDIDLEEAQHIDTLAVNNAWEIAPWAYAMVFGDSRWWVGWGNGERVLKNFKGRIISTNKGIGDPPRVEYYDVSNDYTDLDKDTALQGPDSGSKAISFAYRHMQASTILLAGFDLAVGKDGRTHWHTRHQAPVQKGALANFAEKQAALYRELRDRGVDIFRVTQPGLEAIPYRCLESFL